VTAPWAARYVGMPFKDGGRDASGCDCWGLVRLVLGEQYGVELESYVGQYSSARAVDEVSGLLAGEIPKTGWLAVVGDPRPGDGVLFRLLNAPWHVGVVVGPDEFLHVEEGVGAACVERLSSHRWVRRLIGVYRHEAMA